MSGPPEMERGRLSAASTSPTPIKNTSSMPACPACSGQLTLAQIADCSRRGIYCGPDKCARRQLDVANVDNALRCAELRARAHSYDDVAAFDEFACWLRAQLLDFADLLEAGER